MKTITKTEFKLTEIGAIPEDWEIVRLGEVCSKIGSGITPRGAEKVYKESGVVLVRSQNVYNNSFSKEGLVYLDEATAKEMDNVALENDDVLLNITGDSVARCCTVPEEILPARVNQHVSIIRPNRGRLNPIFLRHYLSSPRMQAFMLSLAESGGTRNALTKGMIEKFLIPKPTLEEQTAIARILSDLDAKIGINKQMSKTLEAICQTIFKRWFIDFDFPNEEGKPYRTSGEEVVYSQELQKEIPKGWVVEKLGDVCTLVTDGSHFSPTEAQDGAGRIATIANMGEFGFDFGSCKRISEEDFQSLVRNGCKPEKGDVLVSKDGTMGKTLVYDDSDDLVLLSSIAILRVGGAVSPYYLRYYLATPSTQETLKAGYMSGSVLTRIVLKDLKQLGILIPPKRLLDKFTSLSSVLHGCVSRNFEQNRTIVALRDLLLPRLISGKIRVPVEVR